MKTNRRREAAIKALASTGMWRSNYLPPMLRLMWRLGLDVPPPHFASFWVNAIVTGSWYGIALGVTMWLVNWVGYRTSAAEILIAATIAGVFFGAWMAVYYAYGRRKYRLPSWLDLQ